MFLNVQGFVVGSITGTCRFYVAAGMLYIWIANCYIHVITFSRPVWMHEFLTSYRR